MSAINIGNITNATFKVGGADCSIYLGSVKLYPQEEPPTPPFTGKYKFTLNDSSVVSAECDATSAITTADTSAYNATVTDVIIGDCVTTLGNWSNQVFQGCPNLTSVTINCSLSGWTSAFEGCSGVTNLTIGSGVTSARSTLYADMSISSVTDNSSSIVATDESLPFVGYDKYGILKVYKINGSPTKIGNKKFSNCSGLTSVNIPDSVTSIGRSAFSACTSLTSIDIPSGVTNIGDYAFFFCSSLTSITIPSGVTSIGSHAFDSCSSLTSVTIPNGVTSIGDGTFQGCSSLTSIAIPDFVTIINKYTFSNCSGLTSVTIPSGVTSIGELAFGNCYNLTSITIKATTPPTLGDFAFAGSACPLFVPSESLEDYKTAWTDYTDRLQPIV